MTADAERRDRRVVPAAGPPSASGTRPVLAQAVAGGTLAVLGMRLELPGDVSLGAVLAALLVPWWWPLLGRSRSLAWLVGVGGIAILSGVWLTGLNSTQRATSVGLMVASISLIVVVFGGAAVVVWARTLMSSWAVALWFGVGVLAGVRPDVGLAAENVWRFGFALPVTVIVLALLQRFGRRWLEFAAVLALAGVSALTDARSSFAILLLTALLVGWQMRPRRTSRRASAARVVVALALLGGAVYFFGEALILDGFLGDAARERSLAQIDASGSLIVGGRPELAATVALMTQSPLGFGVGTLPSFGDLMTAKEGMASIGYDPNNGYVERYMFGTQYALHSVIGDLWARAGLGGLAMASVLFVILVRGVAVRVAYGSASAVLIYVCVRSIWNLGFGPLFGSAALLAFATGLAVVLDARRPREPGSRTRASASLL